MPVGLILKELIDVIPWGLIVVGVAAVIVGEALGIPLASGIIGWFETIVTGFIDWIVNEIIGGAVPW